MHAGRQLFLFVHVQPGTTELRVLIRQPPDRDTLWIAMSKKSPASMRPSPGHDTDRLLERLRKVCMAMPGAKKEFFALL